MFTKALKRVFSSKLYITQSIATFTLVLSFSVFVPNLGLVRKVLGSSSLTIFRKSKFVVSLFGGLQSSLRPFAAFTIVGVAFLFAINLAMLVYVIQRNRKSSQRLRGGKSIFSSVGGVIAGVFGVGCAVCGSLIITPILTFFGAAGFLSILPFRGSEFGLVAMVLILFSMYLLAKKINNPLICPAD